jgi:hypothetical protein
MKRCPKCDFTFADSQHVCDFDGTDLIYDPQTLPVSPGVSALVAATQSPFLRLVKSPVFLTVLGLAGVLSSLLLIIYYDAASQSNSSAGNQPSQNSFVSPVVPPQTSVPRPAQIKTPATSAGASALADSKRTEKSSSTARGPATASRKLTRPHSPTSARNQPGRSPTALQRESKDTANQKEPKLTAMLKTTWRILKKPFKF